LDFSGGMRLRGPWGNVAVLNLTPDPTGIDCFSEEAFVEALRTGHLPGGSRMNAIMPWGYYRHMTDEDLRALYLYVRSLKPVPHAVDNASPPTPCRKCGNLHGLGLKNG
jgi:hypothetical protein